MPVSDRSCGIKVCASNRYLTSGYCKFHLQDQEIRDRWDRWIEDYARFEPLHHLVVHPNDWLAFDLPTEYKGLPVRPLGVDVCRCKSCTLRRASYAKARQDN